LSLAQKAVLDSLYPRLLILFLITIRHIFSMT
jgi:hypothetical protein